MCVCLLVSLFFLICWPVESCGSSCGWRKFTHVHVMVLGVSVSVWGVNFNLLALSVESHSLGSDMSLFLPKLI